MVYTPRHSQPFTLKQAINLDVSVIVEEIRRLENSLRKLRETQEFLHEATPDPEIARALEENIVVIESQEERIIILKAALTEKGMLSSSHYETELPSIDHAQRSESDTASHAANDHEETEVGVYL